MKPYVFRAGIGEIAISKAQREDLQCVLDLWLEAAKWMLTQGIEQWKPNLFTMDSVQEQYKNAELFVAKTNELVVGCFSVQWSDELIWQELNNDDAGYIHKLVVAREFKGHHIGAHLLACAEEYIKFAGKRSSRLDCKADNERLNAFYRDAGYRFVTKVEGRNWNSSLYEKILA